MHSVEGVPNSDRITFGNHLMDDKVSVVERTMQGQEVLNVLGQRTQRARDAWTATAPGGFDHPK